MTDNRQLKAVLLQANRNIFAVLDGAQFDDLPMALFDRNFIHRSLYLDRGTGPADQLRTAPQLVWLNRTSDQKDDVRDVESQIDERVLDKIFDLLADRPAAVFWLCHAGADVLYRHLRSINKVLYPRPAYIGRDIDIPESGFEIVTFRHADANVMAQISSALDWNGLSRLLGPAEAFLFTPEEDWSPKPMRVQRHDEMPFAHNGPLRIGRIELRNMARVRFEWLTRRTINYLGEYAPAHIQRVSEARLKMDVETWLREAQTSGVTGESAFRKWCYLQMLHDGRLVQSQFAVDFKARRDTAVSADERVHQMMRYMIERAEAA
ncbi:DUF4123 domain-containing protein [Agrobacterium larrymoorei]|uniref:DUF4123 domain-containing protein n=1 Tax=Agrobacterium larrymoorei TaxID=160699 RepID=A0A4D7DWP0_9HYPH|nr:DUF4123 domain-containing protein [Agrobacterium larrymoorei]QCI99229.1 DUF4123 domain-containing protein [Agrobacterium larrymoorei]QYA08765.1 DUF4123 domain-containing protein [Agrobacterium larrymoorei]